MDKLLYLGAEAAVGVFSHNTMIHLHEWQALFYCFSFPLVGFWRFQRNCDYLLPSRDLLPGQRAEKATFLLCIDKRGFTHRTLRQVHSES